MQVVISRDSRACAKAVREIMKRVDRGEQWEWWPRGKGDHHWMTKPMWEDDDSGELMAGTSAGDPESETTPPAGCETCPGPEPGEKGGEGCIDDVMYHLNKEFEANVIATKQNFTWKENGMTWKTVHKMRGHGGPASYGKQECMQCMAIGQRPGHIRPYVDPF